MGAKKPESKAVVSANIRQLMGTNRPKKPAAKPVKAPVPRRSKHGK